MEMKKTEQVTRILSLAGSICRAHPRRRLVGETQTIVAAPQQGDLASVGFEESGHRESDVVERRRDRRPAGFCQEETLVLT